MNNVVVTGYRSIGKTTLVRNLARECSILAYDSDQLVSQKLNSIGLDFSELMEKQEYDPIIKSLLQALSEIDEEQHVLSLVSGALTYEQVRQAVNKYYDLVIVLNLDKLELIEKIKYLYPREKDRQHFRNVSADIIKDRIVDDIRRVDDTLKDMGDVFIDVSSVSIQEAVESAKPYVLQSK